MRRVDPKSLRDAAEAFAPLTDLAAITNVGQALAAAQIGIWQLDVETGLATWDAVTGRILGFGDAPQLDPIPLPIHPEDQADIARRLARNARGEGERDVEVRIVRPGGEVRWVRSTARAPITRDRPGHWVGGVVTDITDAKLAEFAQRESQRQLSMLIDNLPGIAYRCSVEAPWQMTYVSEGVELLTGYKAAEILALETGWSELVFPEDLPLVVQAVDEGVADGRMFSMSYRILHRDGGLRWVLERGRAAYGDDGAPVFLDGFIGDISEQKQIEQSLMEARHAAETQAELVRQVLANTSDCVYSLDAEWRFTWLNPRAEEYFAGRAVIGQSLLETIPGSHEPVFRACFDEALVHRRPASAEGYLPSRKAWFDLNVVPAENGATVFFRDITIRKQAEERVRWAATHDTLTQLPNRLLFQERLDALVDAGVGQFALLVLDVDDFKRVNDLLGHDVGDTLLCTFATRLKRATRADDLVARLGGDEFAVILQGVSTEDQVETAVANIMDSIGEPHVHAGKVLDCSASIGASLFPVHARTRAELLKTADIAVYAAKAAGRRNLQIFRPQMRENMQSRLSMLSLARNALREHRISPFYQPKFELRTGALTGFEALLRWEHPRHGFQTPDTIAAAFEDLSLAAEISDRMIELVIVDMTRWRAEGIEFGHVALNAGAAEFRRGNFAESLLERLAAASLPPELVHLEVTETVFLGRGADYVERALKSLSAAGIRIALDDFGTGYASLSHLKQFPVDLLKIDGSFVGEVETDEGAAAIIRAVINLGKSLEIETVAEGIETAGQHARLADLGCDYGQGYFYSPAIPAEQVPALLSRGH
jgi:diguanylate cyclase (GGDEF)-like protein/PAS domain S-box-containing protein